MTRADTERIVITGMGCVTPLGIDLASTWLGATRGHSGVRSISRFDPSELPVRFGAEVPGEPDLGALSPKETRRFDRFVRFALGAAREALADSGLNLLVAGVAVTSIPVAIGYLFGRKVLSLNPVYLLGAITGSMTSGASLSIVQAEARSSMPALGYTGAYAFANVLLTVAGSVILLL